MTDECGNIVSSEAFNYDAAGNITNAPDSCFVYDTNNRLTTFDGHTVKYDADGNMVSAPLGSSVKSFEYDSANRLTKAGSCTYTYNAEDVRIRNLRNGVDNTYVYNTNCKLSQLLLKTTDGIKTKYVYGLGLIGEERNGYIQVYHYDYRGSTVAVTNECGEITDTFEYDTYGNVTGHIGSTFVIFGYNGRDGVITDRNGLVYMRARYYSPQMRRFINADIIPGEISNAITLNRYAYANGNPVSNVDPFGLEAMLDEYISANYSGVKNISLVIDTPDPSSSVVAKIENGELQNGHSFIRLDDGNGNVQYVGLYMKSEDLKKMIISGDVEGIVRFSDNKSDWDVAKTYELSDKQYSAVSKYIDNLNVDTYNLEKYNCTTFAVEILKKSGVVHWYSMPVKKHLWTLPIDLYAQLENFDKLERYYDMVGENKAFLFSLAASGIMLFMGDNYGYTPATAAQDLLKSEGPVLIKSGNTLSLKEDGSIQPININARAK